MFDRRPSSSSSYWTRARRWLTSSSYSSCCSPSAFMACFKRSDDDQQHRGGAGHSDEAPTRTPLLSNTDEPPSTPKPPKLMESQPPIAASSSDRRAVFTKETSALVRQASNVAAKVHAEDRTSRERQKPANIVVNSWNILRRGSSTDYKNGTGGNNSTSTPPSTPKSRQMSLGGPSPSSSTNNKYGLIDANAKRRLLKFRRQTTTDAALALKNCNQYRQPSPSRRADGGRMSIVAKDWDSVHKVHDPESDVGGVYIGDDDRSPSHIDPSESNGTGGRSQLVSGAFTAMKISESTEFGLSMIDDDGIKD